MEADGRATPDGATATEAPESVEAAVQPAAEAPAEQAPVGEASGEFRTDYLDEGAAAPAGAEPAAEPESGPLAEPEPGAGAETESMAEAAPEAPAESSPELQSYAAAEVASVAETMAVAEPADKTGDIDSTASRATSLPPAEHSVSPVLSEADAPLPDAPAPAPAPAGRPDFFRSLFTDSQRGRARWLAERERWARGLDLVGQDEVLHELEMYLRGLLRYFNLANLPGGRATAAGRDFRFELRAIRDALSRAVHLARLLTVPRAERGLVFRAFVQSQLEDDRVRGRLVEHQLEQRTPDESLFILRTGLAALRGTVDALLALPRVPLAVFNDLGVLLDRQLLGARFFRPPGPLEFRHEYDRLASVPVLEALRATQDHRARRALALAWLSLYRLLRDLQHVPAAPEPLPRRALVVLALARSEAASLAGFLDEHVPRLVEGEGARWQEAAHAAASELRGAVGEAEAALGGPPSDRSAIDAARSALNDGAERAVARLCEVARPGVTGMELFAGPHQRRLAAERLRRDLWVYRELCRRVSEADGAAEGPGPALPSLQRFALEFLDVGYQFLRFGDHPAFDRYLELLAAAPGPDADPGARRRFILETRRFARFLDRTYQQISRRAELVDKPPDPDQYAGALDQYLPAY